ncbi:hypothetical protein MSG28_011638 [Choristoneura fumiferana]|uniref:Uncharacterized protein n=1 Tax=Choristoneura fumiferana TaxID=7141 RepID=A0ACC0KM87_CHOFU|nr:hypothetical protein MSG28_011638 [Choristoneura fumiferana]
MSASEGMSASEIDALPDRIGETFTGQTIFVTGGTGFLGKEEPRYAGFAGTVFGKARTASVRPVGRPTRGNPADFTPLSQEGVMIAFCWQVAAIKTEKKAREQKRRNKTLESRRALANVRVVQNNLVFVVGLPVRLADPEGPSASAYVTYVSPADALRAIQGVNNVALDGRVLKGSLGTPSTAPTSMKNQPCPKPDCMYLHELEMHAGLHQVYERKLHNQLLQAQRDKPEEKHAASGNPSNFIPTTVVTSSHINVVSSSKSKKDSVNISNGSNGIEASNSNGLSVNGNGNGKEAWPSLGSSPPSDSPARKQSSPKPQQSQGE